MSAIFEQELAQVENIVIAEAMGPSMAESEDISEPVTVEVCKWSTREGKIKVLQHLGLAEVMSPEEKWRFMKSYEDFKFTLDSKNKKGVLTIWGDRENSWSWLSVFKKAKIWKRPRVSSVKYQIADTKLTYTVCYK